MRIGLFLACIGRKDGGPETYERELATHIATYDKENEYHVFCFSPEAADILKTHEHITVHTLWPNSRWLSLPLSLPLCLARNKIDLYHATFISAPYSMTPCVFTMQDISPFTHPEFYPKHIRRRLLPLVENGLRRSKLILSISEHARQTTADYFKIPLEKMKTVHLGVNPIMKPLESAVAKDILDKAFDIDGPYILYLGKLESRKNIVRILEAFHILRNETDFKGKLVLAGKRYWDMDGIDDTVERLSLHDDVIELGYVPDETIPALYSAAELFIFPTLWEGFGLPILEAMACGTPVVTSSTSCLPEIAGGAARLVDPLSVEEIAAGMAHVILDTSEREKMVERGLVRAKELSWDKTAKETAAAYRFVNEMA